MAAASSGKRRASLGQCDGHEGFPIPRVNPETDARFDEATNSFALAKSYKSRREPGHSATREHFRQGFYTARARGSSLFIHDEGHPRFREIEMEVMHTRLLPYAGGV